MPAIAGVLAVVFARFLYSSMHCSFISSEAYSSPSIVIGSTLFSLSHSLHQP